MRKLISILLLAILGLPLASPLLALSSDADPAVPICCRKNGQHHCLMSSLVARRSSPASSRPEIRLTTAQDKCPYTPELAPATQQSPFVMVPTVCRFRSQITRAEAIAQTESKWRIARDRSRQKRGPPAPSLL